MKIKVRHPVKVRETQFLDPTVIARVQNDETVKPQKPIRNAIIEALKNLLEDLETDPEAKALDFPAVTESKISITIQVNEE
jgi:hypothetical protein